MKILTRKLQTSIILAIVFALPHLAFAIRTVQSVTPSPISASVLAGTATNVTANVAVVSGSGASTRYLGLCTNFAFITPAEPTITATLNPTSFNFPNANNTSNTTLTVTTTAGTPAGTYTVSIVCGTNGIPNANIGDVTNTFTLTVGGAFVPKTIWTNGAANLNWSSSGNWTGNAAPVSSNDVTFYDISLVGTQGQVDNTVNASMSIGSLTFGQTNNYHTTQISAATTLTVGATANGLNAGTGTDPGDSIVPTTTITGAGGALAVTNKNSVINISQAHGTAGNAVAQSRATVDMAGLDTFSATVSRVLVGVDTVTLKGACGVLNLAKTNTVTVTVGSTAPQIDVGDNSQATGTPTIQSILSLGQTNGIFADSIAIGRGKTDNNGGLMNFNSAFTSPTAFFRGTNGAASRVGSWFVGDGATARTYYTYGTCDFSLGTVNALVDTMYLGKGATGSTPQNAGTGTLTFGAGTVDVNTLEVGYSFNATGTGTGTVNANGGTLLVNTLLELGHGSGSSGTLNISNATVTANGGITQGGGAASISMTGGTLNVTNVTATIGTTASALAAFSVSNSTNNLAVQSLTPSIATANLTAASGTTNTLNITAVPLLTGFPTQFSIIQYGLNGGSASGDLTTFVIGNLPSASPAYGAYVSNNVANNSIDIVFTNGPSTPSLTWDGATNGNWDTTTSNWRPKTGPDTAFANGNFATFDESLTGTPNVNLATALSPAAVTVSNSATAYVFSGGGSISGSTALVKNGSGTLTLSESGGDNFSGGVLVNNGTVILADANSAISGGTTINAGTLQIGNNGAAGALPSGNLSDSGALVFNRASNLTVTNAISGAGTITQNDTNVTTLNGNSSFTGTATVSQGTLAVGNSNALGVATSVTVNSGATFDVGGVAFFGNGNTTLAVTVAGAGVGGNGAIINTGTSQSRVLHTVTMTADTTFGGNGDWDIRNSSGNSATADAALNGAFNLTKVGTNTLSLRGVTFDSSLGNINVQAGAITITATATAPITTLGDPNATATVSSNATLTFDTIGTVPAKNIVLNNGGTLKSASTNVLGSPVTLTGAANNTITVNSTAQLTITNALIGGGGFSKNGSGVLFLTTNNSYSGNTVVSGGTLALYGGGTDGSISSSVTININGGTMLDVSGRSDGKFTLTGGQTLNGGLGTNGPGTINGLFTANLGSFVAPGNGITNTGTLSISSNALLQGATEMSISAANGYDQLLANAFTYGGTLIVTNFAGAITNGQTFQLFVGTNGYASNFGGVTLPVATGLTWTNTLTTNGRITAGVVTGPSGPVPLTNSVNGNTLSLSWVAGQGWRLQCQTNSLSVGLTGGGWTYLTDGSVSSTNITVDPNKPAVFYRLTYP